MPAAHVQWDEITAHINKHERDKVRAGGECVAAVACGGYANTAAGKTTARGGGGS